MKYTEPTQDERTELDSGLFNLRQELAWLVGHVQWFQHNYIDEKSGSTCDLKEARKALASMQYHLDLFTRARIRFEQSFWSPDEEDD